MSATNQTPRPRLQDRRARISTIRRRLLAVAIALFIALWVVLLVQLAAGHDPALAKQGSASSHASSSGSSSGGSSSTGASSSTGSSGVSPVTTRQS